MFEQLSLFETSAMPFTVSQLIARIRDTVEADPMLSDLCVEGEVSNFSRATSGHCYFTLKDAGSELRCVMWKNAAASLELLPRDGDMVLAYGRIGVYEQRGSVQLYVEFLEPAGVGQLYRQFEQLKARLEEEGLFDVERKRPLPRFPRRIGIVTSPKAAALQDVLNVLRRRYPLAEILLSPTPVQGDDAPPQIVAALDALNVQGEIDVILVVRGGGSLEDLWAYNDERVARAVAGSRIPVVCGVGHETDFSLSDFAADIRAPTPSAAAEIATPDRTELRMQVGGLSERLVGLLQAVLKDSEWTVAKQVRELEHLTPAGVVRQELQRVDDLFGRAAVAVEKNLLMTQERLSGLKGRLEGVSPEATLRRGYAVLRHRESGAVISSVTQVARGDELAARISDGQIEVKVE